MKRSLKALLTALCFASVLSPGAASSLTARLQTGASDAETAAIQSIRRQYAAINKRVARYKKIRKQLSGFSLEGGALVAHLDGPVVAKIVATHYGEGGRTLEEYYYQQGMLIFVFQKEFRYDRPLSGKVVKTSENRFYFESEQLIRWVGEDGKPVAAGAEFQEKQDEIVATSHKFLKDVRLKGATIEAE